MLSKQNYQHKAAMEHPTNLTMQGATANCEGTVAVGGCTLCWVDHRGRSTVNSRNHKCVCVCVCVRVRMRACLLIAFSWKQILYNFHVIHRSTRNSSNDTFSPDMQGLSGFWQGSPTRTPQNLFILPTQPAMQS
jgi:hypothetical protein